MISSFFNVETMLLVYPMLLRGLWLTLQLAFWAVLLGLAGGVLLATAYSVGGRIVRFLVIIYVDAFRSLPPLVLLIFLFYALPFLGLGISNYAAAILALSLNGASYYGEIVRAGYSSINRGQWDAFTATGMTPLQGIAYVILPQALKSVKGPLAGNTLELAKATSICSAVALPEFLRSAQQAQNLVYNSTPLMMVAVGYLILLWPLVHLVTRMERRSH